MRRSHARVGKEVPLLLDDGIPFAPPRKDSKGVLLLNREVDA